MGEKRLLHLLKELPNVRNHLMHGILPDELDSSMAAICLLGLIRVVRNRFEDPTAKFKYDMPRIEADVFSVIPYTRMEEYGLFAEELLIEEFPGNSLCYCKNCGKQSILNGQCEICFEEMDSLECPKCGEVDHLPSSGKIYKSSNRY